MTPAEAMWDLLQAVARQGGTFTSQEIAVLLYDGPATIVVLPSGRRTICRGSIFVLTA